MMALKSLGLVLAGLLALSGAPAVAQDATQVHPLFSLGQSAYGQLCSKCHGLQLRNPGNSSFDLRKFPTDAFSRFQNSVTHGKGNMPAWGDIITDEELRAIWVYVASRAGTQTLPDEAKAGADGTAAAPPAEGATAPTQQGALVPGEDGKEAVQETASELLEPGKLTVCLARNGGAMSGWRAEGGSGLDYRIAAEIAGALGLELAVTWWESEFDGESDPVKEVYALLGYGLCDLAAAHPLYANAYGPPKWERGLMPRWTGMPDTWVRGTHVTLAPIDVTRPYRREETAMVLGPGAGDRDPAGLDDLGGLHLALQTATLSEAVARAQAPHAVIAEAVTLMPGPTFLWDLERGAADVGLAEVSAFDFHLRQNPVSKLRLGTWRHGLGFNIGFAVPAAAPSLKRDVDAALDRIVGDGTVARLAGEEHVHWSAPREPMVQPLLTLADILRSR